MKETFTFILESFKILFPFDFYLLPLCFMAFGVLVLIIRYLGGGRV